LILREWILTVHNLFVTGIVQGIGFRPYIYKLAKKNNLHGYVLNDSRGVTIEIQGDAAAVVNFEKELKDAPPKRSKIDTIVINEIKPSPKYKEFIIKKSRQETEKTAAISPDLDVCEDCRKELFDPKDRRYLYPFINCTNCGPRFTIIRDVPYDRPLTTMKIFEMCDQCRREYKNPSNRRFHAQPNGCPNCGPKISFFDNNGNELLAGGDSSANEMIFIKIAKLLADGKIIAIKGIGGFHLSCDSKNEEAVAMLRSKKFREDKPFAVMFPDLQSVMELCHVNSGEQQLLEDFRHPIVLLQKKENKRKLAQSVAPDNHWLGAFLPYSPIHHLLLRFFPKPLVMTSGNVSDEPIVYKNSDAFKRLSKIADYFLVFDRDIHVRCDDSVYRYFRNEPYPIRRSRGFAPDIVKVDHHFPRPVLACGPEQKNTFVLAKSNRVFLSHHIGDMENFEVLDSFEKGIEHFRNIFDIEPEVIAYDLHPDYLSTKFAQEYSGKSNIDKIGIQHHHAHAVSCMAENNLKKPVIAIVLDGTGYGTDGTIWGGELLIADYQKFDRVGWFEPAAMPGGKSAIDHPWKMALSYLFHTFGEKLCEMELPFLDKISKNEKQMVLQLIRKRFNSPMTSSCGRLFDGIASIAGVRNSVNYEGQAAVEFEQCIEKDSEQFYDFEVHRDSNNFLIKWETMLHQVVEDVLNKTGVSEISTKFHNGLVNVLSQAAKKIRDEFGISEVVLSGGVFMNIYLLSKLVDSLEESGFSVFTHQKVPANDGGISLGQAVIASVKSIEKKIEIE